MKPATASALREGIISCCLPLLITLGACHEPSPAARAGAPATTTGGLTRCRHEGTTSQNTHERIKRLAAEILVSSEKLNVDPAGLEYWRTPDGPYWVPSGDFMSMAVVIAEQEAEIYGDETRGVREGDIVIDGGAHLGGFVRTCLKRGAALVVAVEPAPVNIECLKRTLASEIAGKKVIVYPKGIWHEDDTLELKMGRHSWGDSVVLDRPGGPGKNPMIPLTTIDKLVEELKLPRVDFIKMDIEGAERNALRGAAETLRQFTPRLAIAAYHRDDDTTAIPDAVRTAEPRYRMCIDGEGHGDQVIFFDIAEPAASYSRPSSGRSGTSGTGT